MQLTRRSFVTKLVVGSASLPFMKGLSSAQVSGKLGYMKIVDTAAMFMAVERGVFTAEGLALQPVPLAGGALIVQGVTSGALQIGMSNVISLYQAHVEGFDLKLVAGGATHVKGPNEDHALVVPQA
jgi:NitT/TauT family transport system substrate-binding protein